MCLQRSLPPITSLRRPRTDVCTDTMLLTILLLSVSLHLLGDSAAQASPPEVCSEQREALRVLRQVQKLLTDHEASYLRGVRTLSKRLNQLRGQLQRREDKDSCPQLKPPRHGRILGRKLKLGHELHVLCDPGYQLSGSESRTCTENQTWSGQLAVCSELPSATNTSSSALRPARCSTAQGVQHCSCDPGYLIQTGGLCQDIDECGLYQGRAGSKLCVHECVNTPGAYHCVCPRGYLLESQPNTCKDVDECVSKEAACPGEQCVNLYGGFTCVRPECPKPKMNATYVKVSGHQCERTPCPVGSSGCLDAPHSVSFHYIPVQSQLPVPRVLFTMTAPRSQAESQRFTLTRGKGPRGLEVRQAGRHRGELLLTKPVSGPAEIQVDVEMEETSAEGPQGRHVFTVTIFVSQFTF
ncbi:fibulin-7-like isoform X1 [Ranitomeya variabilis]|uniref:fibulin-7-like isoform X1 n=2 Tax=Ranitomeya variabilis TaxID=490064 RepID=UPI004056DE92